MSPKIRLSLEIVEDTESPEQDSLLYQAWLTASDGKVDCVEFSAPDDLLTFSEKSPERETWVLASVSRALLQEDWLRGELDLEDVRSALREGRLEWEGCYAHWGAWPTGRTLEGFTVCQSQVAAARLEEALPPPQPPCFKSRF